MVLQGTYYVLVGDLSTLEVSILRKVSLMRKLFSITLGLINENVSHFIVLLMRTRYVSLKIIIIPVSESPY